MLLLHPAPTCADAGPDLCALVDVCVCGGGANNDSLIN